MDANPEKELESSFLPVYALMRSILYSDYGRKSAHYTKMQIAVLAALYWQNEMCMSQIAELISTPRAQMTRAMVPLVEDGMVERFADKKNRRLVHIRLTEAGRAFVKGYLRSRFDVLRERLSDEDSARLSEAAETIAEILSGLRVRK